MKKLSMLLALVSMTALAQIQGNGALNTTTFAISEISRFQLNMYADVTLDASLPSQITIQAESNLIDNIDFEVVGGTLNLQQREWITPTKPIQITIGIPALKSVEVGSHKTVKVLGLNQETMVLTALIGAIEVQGRVTEVSLNAERGTIDASRLNVKRAQLNVWDAGKVIVNATESVTGSVDKDARITFKNTPATIAPQIKRTLASQNKQRFEDAKYINFKIKNNSWNRNQFAVKGPKADGSYFGYGFPMMPGSVKKERWTVGTKVYKVNKLGLRKLLIEIKAADEGKTLNLFE